jgi:hypothetical protein
MADKDMTVFWPNVAQMTMPLPTCVFSEFSLGIIPSHLERGHGDVLDGLKASVVLANGGTEFVWVHVRSETTERLGRSGMVRRCDENPGGREGEDSGDERAGPCDGEQPRKTS